MSNVLENFKIYDFPNKLRLGEQNDGGYVIGELNSNYDFYISAGVSTEESFSRDFINKYNMEKNNCAAFDGTIDNYPTEYTNKIVFYKRNIAPNNNIGFWQFEKIFYIKKKICIYA